MAVGSVGAETVFLEAEGFSDLGGWVVDTQSMDQMGSAYLLAHGLGTTVQDAATTVTVPKAGKYHLWVRTRDWVAPWKAPGSPGKFEVMIDGKAASATFGTKGDAWHWQDGGKVTLDKDEVTIALHDLTGFDGRCDAIVLSDGETPPPNDPKALAEFRRTMLKLGEPKDQGEFDLVVVGGGMAGTCSAISAARHGPQGGPDPGPAGTGRKQLLGGAGASQRRDSSAAVPASWRCGGRTRQRKTGQRPAGRQLRRC